MIPWTNDPETGDDRVAPGNACPHCGEDRPDYLVWLDDRWVRCSTCGLTYDPNEADRQRN